MRLIDEIKLDKEIKNLIIYKKALFNSDYLQMRMIYCKY